MAFVSGVTNDSRKSVVSDVTRFTLLTFDPFAVTEGLPAAVTHPLGVSRSGGAAEHQNQQQRDDPPPRAARSLHADGHTAAESPLIAQSPR